jgi:hypothetical protein
MDSKRQYVTHGGIGRHRLYIHVPEDASPDEFLTRMWVQHIQETDVEAMFEIDERTGAHTYQRLSEIAMLEFDDEFDPSDFTDANIERANLAHAQMAVNGLGRLIRAVRDEFEIVKFNS